VKRIAFLLAALAGAVAFLVTTGAGGGSGDPKYTVEIDNAFGLITGGDVKVAGVRAGKISSLKLDRKTKRALVGIDITKTGFGSFRKDVHCEVRPQSLIGEYFVDCLPGTSPVKLKGNFIPVAQTGSTVPPDLVNDILRVPYRERLRILLDELGAGVAGRGGDLNAALRRANPALRETDRVLKILADQNQVLKNLTSNGDRVITALANNKQNVGRWVTEAKNTAQASAERRTELAQTFHKLPFFLEQLRPTMRSLGNVATEQTPALQDLNASSKQLDRFFRNLAPFSRASLPAFKALGQASVTGRQAVKAATPTVTQLQKFAANTPELGKNLAIILEDLDNRNRAVEKDARSPGGQGYTGLEALLSYVVNQALAINIFDGNAYVLKVSVIGGGACANYTDAKGAKDPSVKDCPSVLGPSQPGINQPDPTLPASRNAKTNDRQAKTHHGGADTTAPSTGGGGGSQDGSGNSGGSNGSSGGGSSSGPPIDLNKTLQQIFGNPPPAPGTPSTPPVPLPGGVGGLGGSSGGGVGGIGGVTGRSASSVDPTQMLDYLLAP
jgi:virulence factor Mce-like protein